MKKIYSLFAAIAAIAFAAFSEHTVHNEGVQSGLPSRLEALKKVTGAIGNITQEVMYREPADLFTMGYTPLNSFYGKVVVRRGGAYKPHTWTNTSTGFAPMEYSFEWTYDSPEGNGQGETLLTTDATELTLTYPYNDGWWKAPTLAAKASLADQRYEPKFQYRFGGPSPLVFSDAVLDFGMTPYSQMLYTDVNGRRTTTFGTLTYKPSDEDPYSVARWISVLPDKQDLKMKGFYNIFHKPDSPYAITKIWGYIEYTALKEAVLTMTLYKLDDQGNPTKEVIATGKKDIEANSSDKSLLFDLRRPGETGAVEPITIDCGFVAVLEGFGSDPDAFYRILPILGSGTVWEGDGECPWPHNCGVILSWDNNGTEEKGYFLDNKVYEEGRGSTKKLCACDFLWMVDGDFAWIFEKSGKKEAVLPLAGGTDSFVMNSYYPLDNEYVRITKDAGWIDFTVSAATDVASENGLSVTAEATDTEREGHITITGPAMNYVITVKQSDSSLVSEITGEKAVVTTEYFDMSGRVLVEAPLKGIYIKTETFADGSRTSTKVCR